MHEFTKYEFSTHRERGDLIDANKYTHGLRSVNNNLFDMDADTTREHKYKLKNVVKLVLALCNNIFCSFFAFRLDMHVRCDNQYKTGADGGNILGQPRLFELHGCLRFEPGA